jgi:hypothetical protein
VDYRGVFQPEIEWKFHPLKIELTLYISCPKEFFLQGISQIIFYTTTG